MLYRNRLAVAGWVCPQAVLIRVVTGELKLHEATL